MTSSQGEARAVLPRKGLRLYEVAAVCGVTVRTIYRLLNEGLFPPPDFARGRLKIWKLETVDRFLSGEHKPARGRKARVGA